MSRAYLKVAYFVRLIAIATRLGLALQPRQRAIKWVTRAFFLALRVAGANLTGPVSLLIELLVKLLLNLVSKSRPDADAEFALSILKEVHGGRSGSMNRSRIVEQMCREPDEESSFYSDYCVRGYGRHDLQHAGRQSVALHHASVIGCCCGLEDHPSKHAVRTDI